MPPKLELLGFGEIPAGGNGGPYPRHVRGDLRLIRQAIRAGWLDDSDASKKSRIMGYLSSALKCRHSRTMLAAVWGILEAERANARLGE